MEDLKNGRRCRGQVAPIAIGLQMEIAQSRLAFLQHYVMHPVSFRCEVAPKSRLGTAQSYQTILVGTAPSDNTQNAPMGSVYTGTVGGCQ